MTGRFRILPSTAFYKLTQAQIAGPTSAQRMRTVIAGQARFRRSLQDNPGDRFHIDGIGADGAAGGMDAPEQRFAFGHSLHPKQSGYDNR